MGLQNIIADPMSAYDINSMVNDLLIYQRLRFSSDADNVHLTNVCIIIIINNTNINKIGRAHV